MIIMQLKNISKSFAGIPLLRDVQLEVRKQDRIALVGRNGTGKSTLLKMMTGRESYDSGDIYMPKSLEIGYLAQHNALESDLTIWEEMLTVFSDLIEEEHILKKMAEQIEEISLTGAHDERLMIEYGQRQEAFQEKGGYRYQSDVKGVLNGLGFSYEDFSLQIQDLSGGQKTRLALGKLLLQKPDVLILDEPTNHLDIPTLTWLENYLQGYPGALIIVSHDRYFLDKIVDIVYEIAHQQAIKYHGTYSNFLEQKAANYDQDMKLYEKQQKEIKEMEDFIARNIARASTSKRAQSTRKKLDKMVKLDRPLGDAKSASFSFKIAKASGNDVLQINDFSYTHEGETEPLFSQINAAIYRGQRIALIGENGIGKTTLLRAILQEEPSINLGANVEVGYYAQEQEKLNPKNTILEEVWSTFPNKDEQTIRTTLGNFLFTGEEVLKTINMLSGGEKARTALAKLMLQEANFLVLDEPTNHLDLDSKEVLEAALSRFKGTILFVSHDRYFINKIADHVFELTKSGITTYLGDYDYYMEKKTEEAKIKQLEEEPKERETETSQGNLSFQQQKQLQREERKRQREIEKIEQDIEELEKAIADLETEMADPEIVQQHQRLLDLSSQVEEKKAKVESLMEVWTELQI